MAVSNENYNTEQKQQLSATLFCEFVNDVRLRRSLVEKVQETKEKLKTKLFRSKNCRFNYRLKHSRHKEWVWVPP